MITKTFLQVTQPTDCACCKEEVEEGGDMVHIYDPRALINKEYLLCIPCDKAEDEADNLQGRCLAEDPRDNNDWDY